MNRSHQRIPVNPLPWILLRLEPVWMGAGYRPTFIFQLGKRPVSIYPVSGWLLGISRDAAKSDQGLWDDGNPENSLHLRQFT
jgi:hypothetical protein